MMRKKNMLIIGLVICLIGLVSSSAFCDLKEPLKEVINQSGNSKPEVNNSNTAQPKVVTTTADDTSLSGRQQNKENSTLTPIQTAKSLAVGMIASGTTEESVIKATLISYGYEETEAEIAYAQALTSDMLVSPGTELAATEPEITVPVIDPQTRVQQTLTKPNMKFADTNQVSQDEAATVNTMLDEGYTIEQITKGFAANGYTSETIVAVFKTAGISSTDAYKALSSVAIEQAETNIDQEVKPLAKFNTNSIADQDKAKQDAKQNAIKTTIDEMQSDGYDIQGILDSAVQDLKDSGMSAQGVKDFLIAKVADGKPKAKFTKSGKQWSISINRVKNMQSYGQGEISLATAMIKAGYTKSEVESTLQSGNYKYTGGDTHMIVSAAQRVASGQATADLQPVDTTNVNKTTQTDILKRDTQALPI